MKIGEQQYYVRLNNAAATIEELNRIPVRADERGRIPAPDAFNEDLESRVGERGGGMWQGVALCYPVDPFSCPPHSGMALDRAFDQRLAGLINSGARGVLQGGLKGVER